MSQYRQLFDMVSGDFVGADMVDDYMIFGLSAGRRATLADDDEGNLLGGVIWLWEDSDGLEDEEEMIDEGFETFEWIDRDGEILASISYTTVKDFTERLFSLYQFLFNFDFVRIDYSKGEAPTGMVDGLPEWLQVGKGRIKDEEQLVEDFRQWFRF